MPDPLKVALVILEPLPGDMSRVYRGLKAAKEFSDAGDDVVVLFDGSGVDALAAVSDPESPLHPLISALRPVVRGACKYCSTSHKVRDELEAAGWPLLDDFAGEASVRALAVEGRQILTY